MIKARWRYYFDFVWLPVVAALTFRTPVWQVAAGVVLFTFIEYWVHRLVLHRLLWYSTHQMHHRRPSARVVFPLWYTPLIFFVVFCLLPLPLFSGFCIGGIWFFGWHHVLHHWDLRKRPWLKAYERWHNLHHRDIPVNYGITHPFWDIMFGTYMSPADARWP